MTHDARGLPLLPADREHERGTTLILSAVVVTVSLGLGLVAVSSAHRVTDYTDTRGHGNRLEVQATAVADLLVHGLWEDFQSRRGGGGTLRDFRSALDGADNLFGTPLAPGAANGDPGPTFDALDSLGLPAAAGGNRSFGGMILSRLAVRRTDHETRSTIEVLATMRTGTGADARERSIRQAFSVAGELFSGFDFSLLSNNVNCILCHARFSDAAYEWAPDRSQAEAQRVKVGTLESLLVRVGRADSIIGGTLYVRGQVTDKTGNPLSDLIGSTVRGWSFDPDGRLLTDARGDLIESELIPAVGSPLPAGGQLYMDYPIVKGEQTDGVMPESFPAPVPDLNGNRTVDAAEFQAATSTADGSLAGGVLYQVAAGQQYRGRLPLSGNVSRVDASSDRHLIMTGTAADPIVIDGTVAIDGDVALSGVIKGDGTLFVSGNVYVLGDLQYADGVDADGKRTFGLADDGSTNALAVAAGGNLVIGDHIVSKHGNAVTGDGSGDFNFTMSEILLFNRMEWTRTQPTLPGAGGTMVANPLYDPHHRPRYYVHGNGDPVYVFDGQGNRGNTRPRIVFDPASATWKGREHLGHYDHSNMSTYRPGDPEYDDATILSLGSAGDWLPESVLQGFWSDVQTFRAPGPLAIDALLYTNNSAWALVRKSSIYAGQTVLNGSLVAADVGLLSAGVGGTGLQLNYDQRLKDKIRITDNLGDAVLRRLLWAPVAAGGALP